MSLIKRVYNQLLRPYLPYKYAVYNGVAVKNIRLFDETDDYPNYEGPLIEAIRTRVSPDDNVVIVGGGLGVSSVIAAHSAGPSGSVRTYEGGVERYKTTQKTVDTARVADRVTISHAIVSEAVDIAGETGGADHVAPSNLPESDVLVLDCEGAELSILSELTEGPETIIVETHAFLDSTEDEVRDLLNDRDYRIVNRGIEAEDLGVYVLTAIRE